MTSAGRLAFLPFAGRTLRVTERHLPLVLTLAVGVFALTKFLLWAKASLLPAPVFSPFDRTQDVMVAGLYSVLEARAFLFPARVFEVLAAGLIAHRVYDWWKGQPGSLKSGVTAVIRNAGALTVIALFWLIAEVLPILPEWFKAPPEPPVWLSGTYGVWLYMTVYWHPIQELGYAFIALLWVALCVAVPASVIENLGPVAALRRSVALTKANYLRILGVWAIYTAAGALIVLTTPLADSAVRPGSIPSKEIVNAIRMILAVVFAAIGAAAIYAETRKLEGVTSQTGATAPAPTTAR